MDKDIQTKLASILDWAEAWAKTSETFMVEQTPLYIQELLNWGFYSSLIPFCFGAIGLLNMMVMITIFAKGLLKNSKIIDHGGFVFYFVMSMLLGIIGIFSVLENLDWLQIMIAPKVWILEYLSSNLR